MTKKRFTLNTTGGNYAIEDNQENIGCFVANKESGEYLVELLNMLHEENQSLKQQLNRLYNYFEDWYSDISSANNFSEIWDKVKEDERWGDDVE